MSAKLLLLASLLVSISAFAYPPPEITAAGLTLRIEGLDQGARPKKADWDRRKINVREYDAARPLPLVFTLSNATDRVVRGDFTVWMNDDWEVEGGESEKIEVQAGAVVTRTRTAKALENVLPALYPVHARFVAEDGTELHPIAVIRAKTPNRAFTLTPRFRAQIYEGAWRLDSGFDYTVTMEVGGKRREVADKRKSDPVSNGSFVKSSGAGFDNGVPARRGFCSHPPYMTGAGAVYADFTVELPSVRPIIFRFANALSNAGKDKNPGDGVVTSVFARPEGGEMREVFKQAVPVSGVWQEGRVDLSEYAGKKITLRLKGDPGPQGNTAWDSYAWGDPVIEVGEVPAPTDEAGWLVRERAATEKAFKALKEGADSRAGTYLLTADGDAYGAGVEYGPAGLLDAVIAFTDGKSASVAIRGFELEVDGEALTCLKSAPAVRGQVYAEQGALKVAWDTRSARKTADGSPRFTRLTTGRATHKAKRVYGGTGAVWEDLDRLKLLQSGFALSTRHVGFEFTNGLALVEATDVPCDYLEVDTSNRIARLVTHNDAVFAFVPSSRGAFDAARRFAKVSGYKTSPGFKAMLGKTCIDDWSREYLNQAAALRMSKKYGLDHVLYLQHNWQRWGYDARLPEVYPPKGDIAAFDEMARTANGLGYRFGIHDNYVDYYPDAAGFSYDLICFKEDGTPLEAWYNPGPRSLSYRWLAHAIHPTLKRNQELLKKHHPTALFLDVFTASNLKDYYDRNGVFYPKSRNVVEWCKAWNESREAYGVTDAIMVSEAGSDSQIGAIDAGQCDHFTPDYLAEKSVFSEGERVPWHDTVSHGKMHLFGGGLGFRYSRAKPADQTGDNGLHGYGTDDYFCTTLIGGRTPMAPSFSRLTVNTYWMLNGICAELAGSDFLDFEFADGLHRQHASFGGGEVWINRDTKRGLWKLGGKLLPVYGFYAKTRGGKEAGVVSLDGQRAGFARKPGLFYVDARPLAGKGEVSGISSRALSADCSKPDTVAVKTQWDLSGPIAPQFVPFTHVVPLGGTDIRMHGHGVKWTPDEKATVGRYEKDVVVTVSKDVPDGEYAILYGMFDPQGPRLSIRGMCDDERRVYGGVITVSHAADGRRELAWRAGGVTGRDRDLEFNVERKMLDFGGIRTDGAFRFKHPEMVLTPLPASGPIRAEIDLSKFGAAGRRLAAVEAVEPMKYADVPVWRQEGERVMLELDCAAFAYQLQFAE